MKERIFTVFFDTDEAPQDFSTYKAAKEYAEERVKEGYANTYDIEEA
jgi:hypothetical protein